MTIRAEGQLTLTDRYANRKGPRNPGKGPGYDPDVPSPGCYRLQRQGHPDRVVAIKLAPPRDPETGEEMLERPLAWQASVDGQPVPVAQVWPHCARQRISQDEHDRIAQRNATLDPDSPFYDAQKPIDLLRAPPPF